MFVVNFNYSVDQFDKLTPTQAYSILDLKHEYDQNKFEILRNEFRTISFFVLKSGMNETNHIHTPTDLYSLNIDKQFEEQEKYKYENMIVDDELLKWSKSIMDKL